MNDGERSLAVFIDFENLALGFQGRRDRFDIVARARAPGGKGQDRRQEGLLPTGAASCPTPRPLHEAAIELIEIPRRSQTGKNSADIRLCVDAMDLAYSKDHIDTFVIVSGDSDFSPLVSKLKELGKHVIGLGMQESTSDLLRDNCDEFIYYEDLGKAPALTPAVDPQLPEAKRKAFALLMESLLALRRENKEVLWSSMIKDTMKRKKPSFNESYHGYRTFSDLLEDAKKEGLLELDTDKRSRTYVVTRFGDGDDRPGRGGRRRRPARSRAAVAPAPSAARRRGPDDAGRRRRRARRRSATSAPNRSPPPKRRRPGGRRSPTRTFLSRSPS